MFAIAAGPLPVPDGTTPEAFESGHAKRDPTVVANEPGCLMYQLVKTKDGKYYMIELYKDKEALDTHFKNMGAKGAPPLEKIKPGGMLQIYEVCSAILKEGHGTISNIVKIPVKDGALFEQTVVPAMVEMDRLEPDTLAYISCKSHDGKSYFFLEIFKDQEAIAFHGKQPHFKAMGKKMAPAMAGKPDMSMTGLAMCGNTPRKTTNAAAPSKL